MKSNAETGHAKNVANFNDLINCLATYGTNYNPAKDKLKIPNLNTIATNSRNTITNVALKNTEFNSAINSRALAFENLKSLSTRLVNALEATDAPKKMIEDAKGFNRKLQGKRAGAIRIHTNEDEPAPVTISTSQQSFDQQIQHFAALIMVLQSEESYQPNEGELKIETLTAKQNELLAKNNAVSVAHNVISSARITRNKALYNETTGLVEIATEVKKYIKSVYGAKSPEFAQVKGIRFQNRE